MTTLARLVAATVAALALPWCVRADAVDELVHGYLQRHQVPGISIAICRDGRVERAAGYGEANVELGVAATPETVYQTGSVGKQFTAMAVMLLVDAGKLGLDDHITRYFPGAPPAWNEITVRHLLTHTSGIKDWEGKTDIDYRRDYTEDELVKVAMSLPPDFAPGTQWSYSNTGYVLLGILVHRISGQFYGDFLAGHVFKPLGMESTRVISEADIVRHRADGYTRESGRLQNQEWVAPSLNTTADGSLYSTVLDLARWDAALASGRFLRPASYAAMWSPVRLRNGTTYPYGFGWSLDDQRGERVIKHGGSWQGFRAAIARYPGRKLSVIVLANLAEAQPEQLAEELAGLVEPSLAWPDVAKSAADPDPARTARLRGVLQAWANGEPSMAMAQGLREANAGTARDKAGRKQLQDELAAATGFRFLAEDDLRGHDLQLRGESIRHVLYFGLDGEHVRRVRFFLNGKGKVAEFSIEPVD